MGVVLVVDLTKRASLVVQATGWPDGLPEGMYGGLQ